MDLNFCPKCGKPLEPDVNFCPVCGFALSSFTSNKTTPLPTSPPTDTNVATPSNAGKTSRPHWEDYYKTKPEENPNSFTPPQGFNIGAAFLTPWWLLAHKQYGWAVACFIYSFIYFGIVADANSPNCGGVFISLLMVIARIIFLGSQGNRLAVEKRKFENIEQFNKVQSAWTISAIISLVLWWLPFLGMFLQAI